MFWDLVHKHFKSHEIAFLDGLDFHTTESRKLVKEASGHGTVFVREISSLLMIGTDTENSDTAGSPNAKRIFDLRST